MGCDFFKKNKELNENNVALSPFKRRQSIKAELMKKNTLLQKLPSQMSDNSDEYLKDPKGNQNCQNYFAIQTNLEDYYNNQPVLFIDHYSQNLIQIYQLLDIIDRDYTIDYLIGDCVGLFKYGIIIRIEEKEFLQIQHNSIVNKRQFQNKEQEKHFLNSLFVQKVLNFEQIEKIQKIYHHKNYFYLISKNVQQIQGLFQYIKSQNNITEHDIRSFMEDIIIQAQKLQIQNLWNLSISFDSLKVNGEKKAFMSDFRYIVKGLQLQIQFIFHKNYIFSAPEIVQNQKYGQKADVWSLGTLLYILLSAIYPIGEVPYDESQYLKFVKQINYDNFIWKYVSDEVKDLLKKMLVITPKNRIDLSKILMHSWFKKNFEKSKSIQTQNFSKFYKLNIQNINCEQFDFEQNLKCYISIQGIQKDQIKFFIQKHLKTENELNNDIFSFLSQYMIQDDLNVIFQKVLRVSKIEGEEINIDDFFQCVHNIRFKQLYFSLKEMYDQIKKNTKFGLIDNVKTFLNKVIFNLQLKTILYNHFKSEKQILFNDLIKFLIIYAKNIENEEEQQQNQEKTKIINFKINAEQLYQKKIEQGINQNEPDSPLKKNKKIKGMEHSMFSQNSFLKQTTLQDDIQLRPESQKGQRKFKKQTTFMSMNQTFSTSFFQPNKAETDQYKDKLNEFEQQIENESQNNFSSIINIVKEKLTNEEAFKQTSNNWMKQKITTKIPELISILSIIQLEKLVEEETDNFFAYFRLALLYLEEKNLQRTLECFLKVMDLNPDYHADKVRLALAQIYEHNQQYMEANMQHYFLYNYIETTQDKKKCLCNIKKNFKLMGDYTNAIKTLDLAVRLDNKDPFIYEKLGWLQIKGNFIKSGVDNLQKAHSLAPKNLRISQKLAEGLLLKGGDNDIMSAQDYYLRVYEEQPSNFDVIVGLAKVQEKLKHLDKSIELVKIAYELAENDKSLNVNDDQQNKILFYQCLLYFKLNDTISGILVLKKILEKNPNHIESLIEYATFLTKSNGDTQKSLKYFLHALFIDPSNLIANFRAGQLYQYQLNDKEKAIKLYTNIIEKYPDYYQAHYFLAICHLDLLNYQESIQHFRQVIILEPNFISAWKELASVYMESNQYLKALNILLKAREIPTYQKDQEISQTLADCYFFQGNYEQAINLYKAFLIDNENNESEYKKAEIYYQIGVCELQRKNYQQAIIEFENSITYNSNASETYYNYGIAFIQLKNFIQAYEKFEHAYQLDRKNVSSLYNMANCQYIINNKQNAYQLLEQLIEQDSQNQEWRNYLASLYIENKIFNLARDHLEKSFQINDQYIDTYLKFAQLCLAQEDNQGALEYLNKAFKINREDEELRKMFAKIMSNNNDEDLKKEQKEDLLSSKYHFKI